MTVEEMINFNTQECVTLFRKEVEAKIINGVYTVSSKNGFDFNEEEIKKMLLMFKPMQKELRTYKKALELTCKDIAEIDAEHHGPFANDKDYWVNLYLKKAREQE